MKKIIQNISYIIIINFFSLQQVFGQVSKDNILPTNSTKALNPTSGNLELGGIFSWFRGELTTIVFIISVGVFVFIGIRMASARGNPEEFKKAWVHFVYAIIGILIVFLALGMVKLISNLASNF